MDSAAWLKSWHSNGTHVELAELMYYRSKVPAFLKQQRQRPPRTPTGAMLSKYKGRGMEFDEVRHYQAGDDIRAIDWRVTARTGSPHTKLFREERERPVMLVVDLNRSMQFGSQLLLKSVQACHVAAALAWLAVAKGDRVGGLIGAIERHAELRPMARPQAVMKLMHSLKELQHESINYCIEGWRQQQLNSHPILSTLLQRVQQVAKPGTQIHIVSDWFAFDQDCQRQLLLLQRHCQVQAIQVFDPLEQTLPAERLLGGLALHDDQQQLVLNQRQAYQSYETAAAAQQQQLEQQLQQVGVPLQSVNAALPLEQQWPEVMK